MTTGRKIKTKATTERLNVLTLKPKTKDQAKLRIRKPPRTDARSKPAPWWMPWFGFSNRGLDRGQEKAKTAALPEEKVGFTSEAEEVGLSGRGGAGQEPGDPGSTRVGSVSFGLRDSTCTMFSFL